MTNASTTDIPEIHQSLLDESERRLGYVFSDRRLLLRALTHSSCAVTRLECNERMEFLGDAVLGMVICEFLYHKHPDRREGLLTQQKSRLVSRSVCMQVGSRLKLDELLLVGKGLQTIPDSLIAAGVESVIAAIYLDGGIEPAAEFIHRVFRKELSASDAAEAENYKSILQEETQRDGVTVPKYVILEERGPDHAREFCVAVELDEQRFEAAWGRSKKEAEQKAAMNALNSMETDSDS
ncbi:MAG: hypothetical protein Fues2KO_42040 [Fuerstiella sp.]